MQRPIIGVTLLWTFGYIIAYGVELPFVSLYTSLVAAMVGVVVWMLNLRGRTAICALLLIIIAAGYFEDYDKRNVTNLSPESLADSDSNANGVYNGIIVSQVEVDGDKASFTMRTDGELSELVAVSVRLLSKQEQQVAAGWQRGDKIGVQGALQAPGEARNFGGFDYRSYLRWKHIHWQLNAKGASQIHAAPPDIWTWRMILRWNDQFRSMLGAGVERLFPPEQSGFMKGMLIGLTDDIEPEQFQQFSKLGLTHIIAISGLNVAIFLGCVLWIMRKLGFTKETYLLTSMALMPLYIMVTGASPSIIRAGLMAMIALYAAYRHTLKDGLHTVLIVGLLMLVWEPYYLLDVSFQLSFLVTIGLILGVPVANKLMPIRSSSWRDAISITVVAQCISFPVSVYYFNQFSLLSLAANFALVPVFSMFTMPAGTASLLISFLYQPAGQVLAWIVAKLNEWIFKLVAISSKWHLFQTIWPTPGIAWIIAYYAAWALLLYFALMNRAAGDTSVSPVEPMLSYKPGKKRSSLGIYARIRNGVSIVRLPAAAVMLLVLMIYAYEPDRWSREGQVHIIDVGQGDSIFIRSPQSRSVILIDGGGTVTFRKPGDEWKQRSDPYEVGRKLLVPLLKKRGIQTIDYLIVSHEDADHIGGLQAVLEQIPVRQLLFNGTLKPSPGVEKLFQTALDYNVKLVKAYAGDILQVDADTRLRFLYPVSLDKAEAVRMESEQNAESVVFVMEMQGTKWLFTGDMEQSSETAVLRMMENDKSASASLDTNASSLPASRQQLLPTGPVDVLKVAHHGSKTSTTEAWLKAWNPKFAVISAGVNNIYRHPHPTIVARLEERGIGVLRTDAHGEVQMSIRDGAIHVRTKLGERS
ncbi:DNA internalization-related competence protein ComEC/Rec2 [Paenibacillus sp. NPDC056579]|uniref:DNA internalization-related competence protein ComEC/Rec2 n=1 Tax=Paenibacillus sp. NPDC056579 TaxID=3345871 RepID=UPI003677B3EA